MSSGSSRKPGTGRVSIFYITYKGRALADRLAAYYSDAEVRKFSPAFLRGLWKQNNSLVFIMASGIVVRTIAPFIKDKKTDPAVIVVDEKGRHVISLLSGHLGGANEWAREIAEFLGGEAVITTASDINDLPSIDLWAEEHGLHIENLDVLPKIATRLINRGLISVWTDTDIDLPDEFVMTDDPERTDMIISRSTMVSEAGRTVLYLRPRNLVLGIGCNSGTGADEIESAVRKTLDENGLSMFSVRSISTIDIKRNEPGLVLFAQRSGLQLLTFSSEELNRVKGVSLSRAAKKATGARAVAEPSAILASGGGRLLVNKQKIGNVTVAVAEKTGEGRKMKRGKIFVVGTGPGRLEHITPYAQKAIQEADAIVGYGTYLDLVLDLIKDKEVISTGMTQEIDRCRKAIELAAAGRTVAVISGGDPGIYAMAGLVLELIKKRNSESGIQKPEIEIIPGISALNACASRLGAPLMHDFATISLSDRLTPWETIEKRLDAASSADFVIALYNPKSKGRTEQISRARQIIMQHRNPATPVGIVKAAMRENESVIVTDLEHMPDHDVDMQSTVIIGNSQTLVWNGLMITPRGYEKKRQFREAGSGQKGKTG